MRESCCQHNASVTLKCAGGVVVLLGAGLSMAAEVVGTVVAGNSPATDVPVQLGSFQATSDKAGRFLIRNVPPKTYDLKCGNAAPIRVEIRDGLNQVRCQRG